MICSLQKSPKPSGLHAKARRLVACERNIRVGVKVLLDPNRPRFKPGRDCIQHRRISTPDRRSQTVRRIICF
jgi:hypothetical protein